MSRLTTATLVLAAVTAMALGPITAQASTASQVWTLGDQGQIEIGIGAGGTTNDPFLKRFLIGWRVAFHPHDVLALDLRFFVSPNLGDADRKALTNQLEQRNEVVPDLSRILFAFTPGLMMTPLHAEEGGASLDFSFFVGGGMVVTQDDEELVQGGEEQYRDQVLPAMSWGVSARVKLFERIAFGLYPQFVTHIEQVSRAEGLNLEMKNNLFMMFQFSVLPGPA